MDAETNFYIHEKLIPLIEYYGEGKVISVLAEIAEDNKQFNLSKALKRLVRFYG